MLSLFKFYIVPSLFKVVIVLLLVKVIILLKSDNLSKSYIDVLLTNLVIVALLLFKVDIVLLLVKVVIV